ncbi:hypothetical protein KKD03_05175 [Patescibacteria group bacterium]|nr:hypothetical protein [Patescibacteria group bacterium]
MKKEVLIAIFVGLTMGLIITFGVYRVKKSITETPTANLEESPPEAEVTTATTILALHNPENGTIQTEKELTVTGTTIPNAFVVLFVNDTDFISNSDESGHFSFKIELTNGTNVLRVHVLNDAGGVTVEERLVVVSDAFEQKETTASKEQL